MMEKLSSNISENIARIREQIAEAAARAGRDPAEISLMAVTKTRTVEEVNACVACGVTLLGENRAQELCERFDGYDRARADIHFIGHLQTNKVRQVVGKVSTVQSVGSLKLAAEISRQSAKLGVTTDLLLEINVGGELSKSGVEPAAAAELCAQVAELGGVRVRGLMAIPPIFEGTAENIACFEKMQRLMVDIRDKNIDNVVMEVLSLGMSDDFPVAIAHGSTLVRLGTAIFGPRSYR